MTGRSFGLIYFSSILEYFLKRFVLITIFTIHFPSEYAVNLTDSNIILTYKTYFRWQLLVIPRILNIL